MISIVVVSRVDDSHLNNCLQSIVRQQYKDVEILVLMLSEKHESQSRVIDFLRILPKIRFIDIPNTPQVDTQFIFEFGIKNTFGEYIVFIEGNDCFYPNILGSLYNAIKGEDPEIVFSYHNSDFPKLSGTYNDKKRIVLGSNSKNIRRFYRRDFAYDKKISGYTSNSCVNSHILHWVSTLKAKSISIILESGSYSVVNPNDINNGSTFQKLVNQYDFLFDYLNNNVNFSGYKSDLLGSWLVYLLKLRPVYGDKKVSYLVVNSNFISKYTEKDFFRVSANLQIERSEQSLLREWYSNCSKKAKTANIFYTLLPTKLSRYVRKNGVKYSINKVIQPVYYRLPDWIKSLIDFIGKKFKGRVSNRELLEKLEYLVKQARFEQYMSMINEEHEKQTLKQLDEIRQELTELRKEVH
ncbi:glycosyltransferase family A protein [Microbulbifer sp. A4B17]|uniref:glycosyltransferase family A protein n=1 Tax=Microbulbifer sp. A4B17 TaxID=359370 RepID=UPI0013004BEF|nr:glycosyltransferase family A protein [Microbulbifer sp. A4B17]